MSQEGISAYRKQSGRCEKFHDGQKMSAMLRVDSRSRRWFEMFRMYAKSPSRKVDRRNKIYRDHPRLKCITMAGDNWNIYLPLCLSPVQKRLGHCRDLPS
jgi:hypothetical protein